MALSRKKRDLNDYIYACNDELTQYCSKKTN